MAMIQKLTLTFALLLTAATLAPAQSKFAVVDLGKVQKSYYKTEILQERLKADQADLKDKLQKEASKHDELAAQLRTLGEEIKDKSLSEAMREEKKEIWEEKELERRKQQRILMETQGRESRFLQEKYARKLQDLLAEIQEIIIKISKEKGLDLVFAKTDQLNPVTQVIYSGPTIPDISDEIITRLNATKPKK